MNGPEGQGRKAYAVLPVALTSQLLDVKNALTITVRNIFPHILTCYQTAVATLNTTTISLVHQMMVLNSIWRMNLMTRIDATSPVVILALRTALEKGEGSVDKDATSFDDCFDSFRLSMMFWH